MQFSTMELAVIWNALRVVSALESLIAEIRTELDRRIKTEETA